MDLLIRLRLKEMSAEIRRLRALPRLRKILEREAEIERLRAENERLTKHAKAMDEIAAERAELLAEFKRFISVCSEGTVRGRAMDLIEAKDWRRVLAAIAKAERK